MEAAKEVKTTSQISSEYGVHPIQVGMWKKQLKEHADKAFADKENQQAKEQQQLIDRLYKLIGQRDVELDWMKKKLHLDS